jgi:serpin B
MYGVMGQSGNFAWSPLSVYLCAAMVHEGARGETRSVMARLLDCDPAESLAIEVQAAIARLESLAGAVFNRKPGQWETYRRYQGITKASRNYDRPPELHIANGLWCLEGLDIDREFLATLESAFKADIKECDFAGDPDAAADAINEWASRNTSGKVPGVVDSGQFNSFTRLVLASAIYFKGAWVGEDYEVRPQQFRGFKGIFNTEAFTQPMRAFEQMGGSFIVEARYRSAPISFIALAPGESGPAEFAEARKGFVDAATRLARQPDEGVEDSLTIPRFSFRSQFDLSTPIADLGAGQLFDPFEADLSGITRSEPLFVSNFRHEAYLDVNEYGTEAAAVTVGDLMFSGRPTREPVHLVLDRPFHFTIMNTRDGLPLFTGSVTGPNAGSK